MINAVIAGETFQLSWHPRRNCYLDKAGHPWIMKGDNLVSDRHGFTDNWKPISEESGEIHEKNWKELNSNGS